MTTDPIAANKAKMRAECGAVVAWLGTYTKGWTPAQHHARAQELRALGIDSACVKLADGGIRWYSDAAELSAIRDAYLSAGLGVIPYVYCYGPALSQAEAERVNQIEAEAAIVAEFFAAGYPVAQCDMEAQYNGLPQYAAVFEEKLRPLTGLLSISTWADPQQQNWEAVAATLAPACNQWVVQAYTNLLAERYPVQYNPAVYTCLAVGVDMTGEFGANDPAEIARQAKAAGHDTLYIWEANGAIANAGLTRELVAIMGGSAPAAPPPPPSPTPSATRTYRIQPGDTLSAIAQREYGNAAEWPRIYAANRGVIGSNPNLIRIGVTLTIPA